MVTAIESRGKGCLVDRSCPCPFYHPWDHWMTRQVPNLGLAEWGLGDGSCLPFAWEVRAHLLHPQGTGLVCPVGRAL